MQEDCQVDGGVQQGYVHHFRSEWCGVGSVGQYGNSFNEVGDTMNWTLWEKTSTHDWEVVHEGPSGDSCKNRCKKLMGSGYQACKHREFMIRDPAGKDWMWTQDNGSIWRIKWNWA